MGDSVENCYNNIINKICSKYPRPARFSDPGGDFSEAAEPLLNGIFNNKII